MELDEGVLCDFLRDPVVVHHEPQGAHEPRIGRRVDVVERGVTRRPRAGPGLDAGLQGGSDVSAAEAHHVTHDDRFGLDCSPVSPP